MLTLAAACGSPPAVVDRSPAAQTLCPSPGSGGTGDTSSGGSAPAGGSDNSGGGSASLGSGAGAGLAASGATDGCPTADVALSAPITVDDSGNAISRNPAMTSFLVPVARGTNLHSISKLTVTGAAGHRLPAQFEVLSRWGGGRDDCAAPIRYAYARVHAVPAPGSATTWTVKNDGAVGAPTTGLKVSESAGAWTIDTGSARFTVRRDRFEGLSKVELLSNSAGAPQVISDLSTAGGQGGFFLAHGGLKSTVNQLPWRLELERRGPEVATVVARGFYAGADKARDLGYTIRLHFFAGSATVRIEHTYYYGAVSGYGVDGLTNTTAIDRAYLAVPLAAAPTGVQVRAVSTVHSVGAGSPVSLEQRKRTPSDVAVTFALQGGGASLETGSAATQPFIATTGGRSTVVAAIARLAEREPQGLRYDPAARALDIDFTSSPIQVGAARGIWSVAAIDFAPAGSPPAARADAVRLAAERPLLGAPQPGYVNATQTIGPYAAQPPAAFARFFSLADDLHRNTRDYLTRYAITGLQIWPDLPRSSCMTDGTCAAASTQLFDGGDNNYWNWSKVGLDEFFRTGRNELAYDFSVGEATTFVETIAVRPDHDRLDSSGVAGMAPCYGSARGYDGVWTEGLNQRKDRCPADYTYDKTLKMAYLATGDDRFVDYFEEAGQAVVSIFGSPPPLQPAQYLELSLFRLSEQRLENLANGAEFARDPQVGASLRQNLKGYVDEMLGKVLVDGHACSTEGTGFNSALELGHCESNQAWMMPVPIEWALRTARFLGHRSLASFLNAHAHQAALQHTVLGANGHPDYAQRNASSSDNAGNGWRTKYTCQASAGGVQGATCTKETNLEADGYFYGDGIVAFLNVFGLVLAADPSDPNQICDWLPDVYRQALADLGDEYLNGHVWGKIPGQAFGMAAETIGALSTCR